VIQQDCVSSTWKIQRASFVNTWFKLPLNDTANFFHFSIVLVVSIRSLDALLCNLWFLNYSVNTTRKKPSISNWSNTFLCFWNACRNPDRKCEARLKIQMFGFENRGSKLDLKEICDGLPWRPSLFGRSRLPKARQYDLNVGFARRNFSGSEIFHGTLGFGRGRPPPVCLSQPIRTGFARDSGYERTFSKLPKAIQVQWKLPEQKDFYILI